MVVAAAGGDQAEVTGEAEQAGLLGFRLVGVEDLHAGQARGGQAGDLGIGYLQGPVRARMGEDGDPAGRADQGDRADRVERVPADVSAAAVGDPVPGERLIGGGDGAAGRHRPGDVRAADHGRPGDGGDIIPADRDAEVDQPIDHGPGPQHAVITDAPGFRGEFRVAGVEQVGQQVQAAAVE